MEKLGEYKAKRKFSQTPEPKGKVLKISKNRFVVHKHQASHLHYDFRLELDGVLKSWAVPKEPPKKEGLKRLAVQVEDHPVDYINFKGIIPEGNYGAGKVEIWDKGQYMILSRKKEELKLKLEGKKLKGIYILVRPKNSRFGKNAWLFFKTKT